MCAKNIFSFKMLHMCLASNSLRIKLKNIKVNGDPPFSLTPMALTLVINASSTACLTGCFAIQFPPKHSAPFRIFPWSWMMGPCKRATQRNTKSHKHLNSWSCPVESRCHVPVGFFRSKWNELHIVHIEHRNSNGENKHKVFWIVLLPKWNLSSYQTTLLICVYVVTTLVFNHDFQLQIWECSWLKFLQGHRKQAKAIQQWA